MSAMCISALYNWFVLSTSYQHVEVSLGKVLMCWSAPCMAAAVFSVWMNYCKCMFWSPQTWLEIVPRSPYYKTVVSHAFMLNSTTDLSSSRFVHRQMSTYQWFIQKCTFFLLRRLGYLTEAEWSHPRLCSSRVHGL